MSVRHRSLVLVMISLAIAVPLAAQDHHGLDPANLDTTCAPCQDFYRYANVLPLRERRLAGAHRAPT